ncbi:hypothetical protein [Mucilaginibacter glaciei]|uniref:Uncharacterized protein n=1 Tax=Mucilaginibacter glaciei TaxID=2772109 RepID=A0A926S799_9SPHI|nr:hypothetical protein [Mucilaginibacter glaciei]MBD1394496.1 hypothetical protein [Mucilaginibacter glaciei]
MKYLKVLAVAIITMFAVEGAQAQVVVKARIGAPAQRVYPARRTVVVNRPVYRRPYRRNVVVTRRAYRRPVYHRPARRTVVVRRRY